MTLERVHRSTTPRPTGAELRAWLDDHFTPDVAAAIGPPGDDSDEAWAARRAWNATLVDAGHAAIGWPVEHGGRGADLAAQLVHAEEMARAGAPGPVNAIGVSNIAPAIMAHGTAEQQARHLRPMLRGDEIWSQGMSEPDAGSDLAALRCRAVRDGDDFVVNGQKTWNSNGHRADWCQLFVRTVRRRPEARRDHRPARRPPHARHRGPPAHDDGRRHRVRRAVVPRGPHPGVGRARRDRSGLAGRHRHPQPRAGGCRVALPHDPRASSTASSSTPATPVSTALPSAGTRSPVAPSRSRNLELLAKRVLDAMLAGRSPGPEGSLVKLAWSTTDQALTTTAVDVLGLDALDGRWARELLASRSLTIAGGTSEVNKNIIGERVLGLPREPR